MSKQSAISNRNETLIEHECYHCGEICPDDSIQKNGKYFCCTGCLFVYDLLQSNELNEFYSMNDSKGITPRKIDPDEFSFLDDKGTIDKLLNYSIGGKSSVTFYIPEIYCSACIWLLENLYRLNPAIVESKVNFLRKEITIIYDEQVASLRQIVELISSIGYKPSLNLSNIEKSKKKGDNKSLLIKLGIAGFCFGNVMLFALPEYFSDGFMDSSIKSFLTYLNLVLSLPAMYAANVYFKSAISGLRAKNINIDVPISIGIIILFLRSLIEVLAQIGPGYFDSLTGLVFFLLIGRVFQKKTYDSISFERDYKAYFPLSVIKSNAGKREYIPISQVKAGDILIIRNNEIIPADSFLLSDTANIDYSFVTGESKPVTLNKGDKMFAGGKVIGNSAESSVIKEYSQSYLTNLWNRFSESNAKSVISKISDTTAKYFTLAIFILGIASLAYWLPQSPSKALDVFTAVLIVACPCAIALSIPFTFGTALRVLAKNQIFVKSDMFIERLSKINTIVFDKTGTLTNPNESVLNYYGVELTEINKSLISSAVSQSTHPLSRMIFDLLASNRLSVPDIFNEIPGKGIMAVIGETVLHIGKLSWLNELGIKIDLNDTKGINTNNGIESQRLPLFNQANESQTYIAINKQTIGYFELISKYRNDIKQVIDEMPKEIELIVLSGDNDTEMPELMKIFPKNTELRFNQLPDDKTNRINTIQQEGKKVMMVGDGLNDALALTKSDIGIAITEKTSNFTPGSDIIMLAERIKDIPRMIQLGKSAYRTVIYSLIISFFYNIIGLSFAIQGLLTPLIAALLMPISSISVVVFVVSTITVKSSAIGFKAIKYS